LGLADHHGYKRILNTDYENSNSSAEHRQSPFEGSVLVGRSACCNRRAE
jgi:hypothetical protein